MKKSEPYKNLVWLIQHKRVNFQKNVAYFKHQDTMNPFYLWYGYTKYWTILREIYSFRQRDISMYDLTRALDEVKIKDMAFLKHLIREDVSGIYSQLTSSNFDPSSNEAQFLLNQLIYNRILGINSFQSEDITLISQGVVYLFHEYIHRDNGLIKQCQGIFDKLPEYIDNQQKNMNTNFNEALDGLSPNVDTKAINELIKSFLQGGAFKKDLQNQVAAEIINNGMDKSVKTLVDSFSKDWKKEIQQLSVKQIKTTKETKYTLSWEIKPEFLKKYAESYAQIAWEKFSNLSDFENYLNSTRQKSNNAAIAAIKDYKTNGASSIALRAFQNFQRHRDIFIQEMTKAFMYQNGKLTDVKKSKGAMGEALDAFIMRIYLGDINYKVEQVGSSQQNLKGQSSTADILVQSDKGNTAFRIQTKEWSAGSLNGKGKGQIGGYFGKQQLSLYDDQKKLYNYFTEDQLTNWRLAVATRHIPSINPEAKIKSLAESFIIPFMRVETVGQYKDGMDIGGNDLYSFQGTYFTASWLLQMVYDEIAKNNKLMSVKFVDSQVSNDERADTWPDGSTPTVKSRIAAYKDYCNNFNLNETDNNGNPLYGDLVVEFQGVQHLYYKILDTLLMFTKDTKKLSAGRAQQKARPSILY